MQDVPIHIPQMLREYCGVGSQVLVSGETVAEVLTNLKSNHPAIYQSICDETGRLRTHINLFLNSEMIRKRQSEQMCDPISARDSLFILTAVSGG